MKRFLSLLLTLTILLCMVPVASAANDEAAAAAETLYGLGLFQGKGTDAGGSPIFALNDVPTRHEAVTMLVRLLGKDAEAKAGSWDLPFTDVDDWARPYVGYAYANGLTTGTSSTTFSGRATIDATQYLTFALRALGYTSGTDFRWDKAWELTDELGLTHGEYPSDSFLRGDIALISAAALEQTLKGSQTILRSVVTAPTVLDENGDIFLVLTSRNKSFRRGSDLGIGGGSHTFEVRLDSNAVSSYTAALEDFSAAKLTQNGSDLTIEVTGSGPNAITVTVGGTSARFRWEAEGGNNNDNAEAKGISLFLPPINTHFTTGNNLGINYGSNSFTVCMNGDAISSYAATVEDSSAAKITQNGSNLTIEVTEAGVNSLTITADGTSAQFSWDAGRTDPFSTGVVLHDPFKDGYFFPDKATGLLYGTFIFEVLLDGQPVSDYTAVLEKNDGCAAIITPGGRLELRVVKGTTNAVNVTVNGQTARFFWEN